MKQFNSRMQAIQDAFNDEYANTPPRFRDGVVRRYCKMFRDCLKTHGVNATVSVVSI